MPDYSHWQEMAAHVQSSYTQAFINGRDKSHALEKFSELKTNRIELGEIQYTSNISITLTSG